jgi:hypothetical protein
MMVATHSHAPKVVTPLAEPFFLVGAERSGTTLLRLMLTHHPQIRCLLESSYLVDYLTPEGGEPDGKVVREQINADRVAQHAGFSLAPGESFVNAARAFVAKDSEASGKAIFGATIHRRLPAVLQVWPHARFVNLIRDPRDVAPSVVAMGWAGNTWFGSRFWLEAQQDAQQLFAQLEPNRGITIRFEDLVSEPVTTLTKICEFLGCDFDPAMLSYPEHSSYPPPDASAAARWKKKLSTKDIRLVEAHVGDWLNTAGYEPSGQPLLQLSAWQRTALLFQNRFAKSSFRIRRHGFFTLLSFTVSRKLGLTKATQQLRRRMHQQTNDILR